MKLNVSKHTDFSLNSLEMTCAKAARWLVCIISLTKNKLCNSIKNIIFQTLILSIQCQKAGNDACTSKFNFVKSLSCHLLTNFGKTKREIIG